MAVTSAGKKLASTAAEAPPIAADTDGCGPGSFSAASAARNWAMERYAYIRAALICRISARPVARSFQAALAPAFQNLTADGDGPTGPPSLLLSHATANNV